MISDLPRRATRVGLLLGLGCLVVVSCGSAHAGEESLLERDVLPILTKNCLGCHGGLKQEGGLDLRTLPAMLKGGESGPAITQTDVTCSINNSTDHFHQGEVAGHRQYLAGVRFIC